MRLCSVTMLVTLLGACSSCKESRPAPELPPQDAQVIDGAADARSDRGAAVDALSDAASPLDDGSTSGWTTLHSESFEQLSIPSTSWRNDERPDDGVFADNGAYFTEQGIAPPVAYRVTQPIGAQGWLTIESYTRDNGTATSDLVRVVSDPAGGTNKVLMISSPRHTDATVIRPTSALPSRYRVSLRVGFASFGDGSGDNGYNDDERAEPWRDASAKTDNGFYWLTILDAVPRPHNNIWIHHHRKVVVDSDNHLPGWWINIWDGSNYTPDGVHPVMMFGLDGTVKGLTDRLELGKPFIAYSNGQWQRENDVGEIRGLDAYKPNTWYRVAIERSGATYTLEVSGDFQFGGQKTYRAEIDAAENCVWHYNRPGEQARSACLDSATWPHTSDAIWPEGAGWPDYFMFGDPHVNYYEGKVYYDDLKLEVPSS